MPTYDTNVLPSTTGIDLGSPTQRWDGYFQNLDVDGSITDININNLYSKTVPLVNVQHSDFGATGDGVTDDAGAIQDAIDYAATVGAGVPGAIVYFPSGTYNILSPLVLPRTGATPTGVVQLVGEGIRSVRLGTSSATSFPTGRALIEWDASATRAYHQRIANFNFLLPNVDGVKAIHYEVTDNSTLNAISIERLQIDLENILIEGSNQFHSQFVRLEGNLINCRIMNLIGDPGPDSYVYDTILLETDTNEFGGAGDDASGFSVSILQGLIGTFRRGGYSQTFKGRMIRSTLRNCFCNGNRNGKGYEFINCHASLVQNISNEGQGEKPQVYLSGCRGMVFDEIGVAAPNDAGSGVGNGIEIVSSQDCTFRNRWATSGSPSFTASGKKIITVDANSHRNRFFGILVNDTFANEITNSGNDNYFEGYNIAASARQSIGTLYHGQVESVTATGTPPLVVASTTTVPNLTVERLDAVANYNGIATVSGGVPAEYATVDLTAQTAAVGTTTLYAVPASGAGQYRLTWNAKVTTPATTGAGTSTLGALTIVYTDPDSVVQTITAPATVAAGTIATTSTGNSTTTVLIGLALTLNCKASTNITYAMAYASNASNEMAYNLHVKLESL